MKNHKTKNNPFKVNHVRSLKLKAKAKAYTGQLKKLKDMVKTKVETADDQMKSLEEVIRQPTNSTTSETDVHIATNIEENEKIEERKKKIVEDFVKNEKNTEEALSKLENWNCST
ncbi:hypothetical protein O3M35_011567 [Rhynocoris fuscipes]|uniref:Uncharacterized protein n=1 Tax=Rhynocoris fuscipes TaxID=488301 RepID=A0AAW1CWP7_9HEMI